MPALFQFSLQGGERDPGGWLRYAPDGELVGQVQVVPDAQLRCNHLWVRLQWHTEGRGDRDEGRVGQVDVYQGVLNANEPRTFSFHFHLPQEPWSYAGHYINIIWEVVAEIDVPLAPDVRGAEPFILTPHTPAVTRI